MYVSHARGIAVRNIWRCLAPILSVVFLRQISSRRLFLILLPIISFADYFLDRHPYLPRHCRKWDFCWVLATLLDQNRTRVAPRRTGQLSVRPTDYACNGLFMALRTQCLQHRAINPRHSERFSRGLRNEDNWRPGRMCRSRVVAAGTTARRPWCRSTRFPIPGSSRRRLPQGSPRHVSPRGRLLPGRRAPRRVPRRSPRFRPLFARPCSRR